MNWNVPLPTGGNALADDVTLTVDLSLVERPSPMKILGIAGSLRRGSHNRRLLRAAGDTLPPGSTFEEWDGLGDLPLYDEDREDSPRLGRGAARRRSRTPTASSSPTPEYNALDPRRAQERARLGLAPVPRRASCATSPSPSSARAPACSARSGRRPRSRKVAQGDRAPTCSTTSCRSGWPTTRSSSTARSPTPSSRPARATSSRRPAARGRLADRAVGMMPG